ncbi:EF-hand domain-containing protein [Pseudoalteromonas holothuriae]|nr:MULTISPECIES: EF-hand domain-containing protein [unclassified Pseudoalteromonas]
MKNSLITIAFLAVSVSAAAQAGDTFSTLDTDNNGSISLAESKVLPALMAKFKELDTDGNGELSAQEFASFKSE